MGDPAGSLLSGQLGRVRLPLWIRTLPASLAGKAQVCNSILAN